MYDIRVPSEAASAPSKKGKELQNMESKSVIIAKSISRVSFHEKKMKKVTFHCGIWITIRITRREFLWFFCKGFNSKKNTKNATSRSTDIALAWCFRLKKK
jgi:hypothetical protein